jgi:hypothetical protein
MLMDGTTDFVRAVSYTCNIWPEQNMVIYFVNAASEHAWQW